MYYFSRGSTGFGDLPSIKLSEFLECVCGVMVSNVFLDNDFFDSRALVQLSLGFRTHCVSIVEQNSSSSLYRQRFFVVPFVSSSSSGHLFSTSLCCCRVSPGFSRILCLIFLGFSMLVIVPWSLLM